MPLPPLVSGYIERPLNPRKSTRNECRSAADTELSNTNREKNTDTNDIITPTVPETQIYSCLEESPLELTPCPLHLDLNSPTTLINDEIVLVLEPTGNSPNMGKDVVCPTGPWPYRVSFLLVVYLIIITLFFITYGIFFHTFNS